MRWLKLLFVILFLSGCNLQNDPCKEYSTTDLYSNMGPNITNPVVLLPDSEYTYYIENFAYVATQYGSKRFGCPLKFKHIPHVDSLIVNNNSVATAKIKYNSTLYIFGVAPGTTSVKVYMSTSFYDDLGIPTNFHPTLKTKVIVN